MRIKILFLAFGTFVLGLASGAAQALELREKMVCMSEAPNYFGSNFAIDLHFEREPQLMYSIYSLQGSHGMDAPQFTREMRGEAISTRNSEKLSLAIEGASFLGSVRGHGLLTLNLQAHEGSSLSGQRVTYFRGKVAESGTKDVNVFCVNGSYKNIYYQYNGVFNFVSGFTF